MDEFQRYAYHDRGVAWQVPLLTLPQARRGRGPPVHRIVVTAGGARKLAASRAPRIMSRHARKLCGEEREEEAHEEVLGRADAMPLDDGIRAGGGAGRRGLGGTFQDTVIQVLFVKVGSKVDPMHLSDSADTRIFLTVSERFVAGQRVAFSVFLKADCRVTFWGPAGQLSARSSQPIDETAARDIASPTRTV